MSAADIAARFKLHRAGREWRGDCPSCGYADAFVLTDGKRGPIGWCASCQDREAIGVALGCDTMRPIGNAEAEREASADAEKMRERAYALWCGSAPCAGTLAERYLAARGLPELAHSKALRFRPDCWHREHRSRLPAMVAAVTDIEGRFLGIHRTWLAPSGHAKADVEPQRKTLGPVWGGAARLDPLAAEIVVGEGIESSASAGGLLGLPAWAAVSAGNLARALTLPPEVMDVTIAADNDEAGHAAAQAAALRWADEGWRVRVAVPDQPGTDFNDVLTEKRCG